MTKVYVAVSVYMENVYDMSVFSTRSKALEHMINRRQVNERSLQYSFHIEEKEVDNPDFKEV